MLKIEKEHKDYQKWMKREKLIRDLMSEDDTKNACLKSYTSIHDYLLIPYTYKKDDGTWDEELFERLVYQSYLPEHIIKDSRNQALGIAFKSDATISLPDSMMGLKENIDRKGTSLDIFARELLDNILLSGRSAIVSDIEDSKPFLSLYNSQETINYEEAAGKYHYFALSETALIDEKETNIRLELKISDGDVIGQRYKQNEKSGQWEAYGDELHPTLYNKEKLDYLPVSYIEEEATLGAAAKTVLKGFRQSAIYFSMVDTLGSGKLFVYTDSDVSAIKGGHLSGVVLDKGSNAELVQLRSDGANVVKEAMVDYFQSAKEQGMEIIIEGANRASAENLYLQTSSKQIKLNKVTDIVSHAITSALRTCAKMIGENEEEVEYKINVKLIERPVDNNFLKELRESVAAGLIRHVDYIRTVDKYAPLDIEVDKDGNNDYETYADLVNSDSVKKQKAISDALALEQ